MGVRMSVNSMGLGGLGRTTKLEFDVTELAKDILSSALGREISQGLPLDQLQEKLPNA